ncbi:putative 2OG-Fe(II) oxygenase family oxidoreductase [Teratosphaeria nubilosa]|uniref:Putative 2OG-Fe(II) oxygenase family oxidoreductase n=1 Tax=Teratosphaeria nubilosa TaxID=161662 RepID=A0A6G1LJC1_9PEZI|nr:putative 2OG-Fe(II) oxygenase family oxidoreductase [Teratosphaeria nubilosa]
MAIGQSIPIIYLRPYLNPSATPAEQAKVIEQVAHACCTYGFLQIKGHGIPLESQRAVIEASKALYDLPQDQKDSLSLKKSPARRGYERLGEQALDNDALADVKEGYYVGREVPAEQAGFLRGPNQWPNLPNNIFRTPVETYHRQAIDLGKKLLEILTIGLGHDIAVLKTFTKDPVANLKLLHYPPHTSEDPKQFGAGAHTDFGTLTILLQQPGKDGLQVHYGGEWISVPALEDVLVVNMGDLIHDWTEGKYNSTLHRVINVSGDERYSVPCFYQGDLSGTNPFRPEDKSGETVEQHIRKKFEKSYALAK